MATSSRECRLNDAESKRSADRPSRPRNRRNQLRRFLCRFCTNRFWFPRRLRAHEAASHGVQFEAAPLRCGQCSQEFADKLALILHQRSQHGKKVLNCSECLRGFINFDPSRLGPKGPLATSSSGKPPAVGTSAKSSNRFKKLNTADCFVVEAEDPVGRCQLAMRPCQTAPSVAEQLRYLCHFCEQDFLDSAQRERHELEAHGEFCVPQLFACSICNVGFLQRHLLIDHLRKHDGGRKNFRNLIVKKRPPKEPEKPVKCPLCRCIFINEKEWQKHSRGPPCVLKRKPVAAKPSRKLWKCFFCQMAFVTAQGRNEHERDDHVTRGRMFRCHVCKLLTKSRPSFQHHYENCTPAFICPFCSVVFVDEKSLKNHSEKHFHNEFPCPQCPLTLMTKRALDQHVYFHGQLSSVGMGKRDVSGSVIDGHEVCHVCGQVLRSVATMRWHVEGKHPCVTAVPTSASIRKTRSCRFCRQLFSDDRLRQAHVKEVHRTCEKCGKCFALERKKRRHACPMQGDVLEATALLEENTLPCAIKTEVDSDCNDGEVEANQSAPKEEEKTPPKRGRGRPRKTTLSKSEQTEKEFRSTAMLARAPVASSATDGSQHAETRQSNTCRICKKSFRSTRLRKVHEKSHIPENVCSFKSSTYPSGVTISRRNRAQNCAQCGALFHKRHALEEHLQLYCMRKQEPTHDSPSDDDVRTYQSPSLSSLPTNAAPSSSASPSTAISGITKEEIDDEAVSASPNPRPTAPRSPKEVNTGASNVRTSSGILRLLYSIEIPSDHAMPQPRQSTIKAGSRLPMLKCRFCTLRFATEYTRRKHETSEHQQKHPETPTESSNSAGQLPSSMDSLAPFQCKICQWPSYTSLKAVEHYESVHFAQGSVISPFLGQIRTVLF